MKVQTVTLEHDVKVMCECGNGLEVSFYHNELIVQPCEKCLDAATEAGKIGTAR